MMDNAGNVVDLGSHVEDLYLLSLIIEAGSFSEAARQHGTTRSRFSRRIIDLERSLGVKLMHRDARRIALTPIGRQIYEQSAIIREATRATANILRRSFDDISGQVRLIADQILLPLLDDALVAYMRRHHGVQLRVMTSDADDGVTPLLRQQADVLCWVGGNLPESNDIVARPIGDVGHLLVASPSWIERHGDGRVDPAQRLILATTHQQDEASIYLLKSSNPSVLLAAARDGMGCAELPAFLCRDDIDAGRLVCLNEGRPSRACNVMALTLRHDAVSKATLELVRHLQDALAVSLGNASPAIEDGDGQDDMMEAVAA